LTLVALPAGLNLLSGIMASAISMAALSMNLEPDESAAVTDDQNNRVDLCVDNAAEVSSGLSAGQSVSFSGKGVRVTFYLDAENHTAVRVEGKGSKAELRAIGDAISKKLVQQYAYHRLVGEMRVRGMNVVDETVEADGTVRLRVRVFQG
jgi:formylmethanofuran dehydrogenase subunit E